MVGLQLANDTAQGGTRPDAVADNVLPPRPGHNNSGSSDWMILATQSLPQDEPQFPPALAFAAAGTENGVLVTHVRTRHTSICTLWKTPHETSLLRTPHFVLRTSVLPFSPSFYTDGGAGALSPGNPPPACATREVSSGATRPIRRSSTWSSTAAGDRCFMTNVAKYRPADKNCYYYVNWDLQGTQQAGKPIEDLEVEPNSLYLVHLYEMSKPQDPGRLLVGRSGQAGVVGRRVGRRPAGGSAGQARRRRDRRAHRNPRVARAGSTTRRAIGCRSSRSGSPSSACPRARSCR